MSCKASTGQHTALMHSKQIGNSGLMLSSGVRPYEGFGDDGEACVVDIRV